MVIALQPLNTSEKKLKGEKQKIDQINRLKTDDVFVLR